MSAGVTYDVQVWSVTRYKGKRKTSYSVRWRVSGKRFHCTFATAKLAESFRATLLVASREGTPFDLSTGTPAELAPQDHRTAWLDHAAAFMDVKWPHASPRHRQGLADGLVTATMAMHPGLSPEDAEKARVGLSKWVFNTAARSGPIGEAAPPEELRQAVTMLHRRSPTLESLSQPAMLRAVLESLSLKLDGSPASPATTRRKRSALYSALNYAVEIGELTVNPMDKITWKAQMHTDEVGRRAVVNPTQAQALLSAVADIYPSLEAFFACMYYAGLRPSEVRHLREADLDLPADNSSWDRSTSPAPPRSPAASGRTAERDGGPSAQAPRSLSVAMEKSPLVAR